MSGGLSGVPTYTQDSEKDKMSRWVVEVWPNVYRFVNGVFYFVITTTKKFVIDMIKMVFQQ